MKLNLKYIHELLTFVQGLKTNTNLTPSEQQTIDKTDGALREILENLEEIHDEFTRLHERVGILKEEKKLEKLDNSFINMVVNRITILKNMIKKDTGNEKEDFFSLHLTTVESIEKDIISTHEVTKEQMERLNEIYKSYVK